MTAERQTWVPDKVLHIYTTCATHARAVGRYLGSGYQTERKHCFYEWFGVQYSTCPTDTSQLLHAHTSRRLQEWGDNVYLKLISTEYKTSTQSRRVQSTRHA